MDEYPETVSRPVYLPVEVDGRTAYAEVSLVGEDDEEVAARLPSFAEFAASLEKLTESVTDAVVGGLRKVKPSKVAVEFGCEIGVESGQLTAILVKGTAKANVKVSLEWKPAEQQADGPSAVNEPPDKP
ncbi:CU044_2847 family protein [Amycolatopsis silviterrae]|uniref:CU044_2847 family protein n=1 Tax=Amycolatopsis silviterrae TaxID=1656914 RepID=A0ABW5HLL1_9PSEU